MRRAREAQGQQPHLVEAFDGARQLGAAAQVGAVPQSVERAGPTAIPGQQQGIQPVALVMSDVAGQGPPQPARCPAADARDQALKRGGAG